MGPAAELLALLVVVALTAAVLRWLFRRDLLRGRGGPTPARKSCAAPAAATGAVWEAHVAAQDHQTIISVRRAAGQGQPLESMEIARFPTNDPDWHEKLLTARSEAVLRATELNTPH